MASHPAGARAVSVRVAGLLRPLCLEAQGSGAVQVEAARVPEMQDWDQHCLTSATLCWSLQVPRPAQIQGEET